MRTFEEGELVFSIRDIRRLVMIHAAKLGYTNLSYADEVIFNGWFSKPKLIEMRVPAKSESDE